MRFGDLKNDVLFRKVFAQHPALTAALLNDVLEREGRERIAEVTLLSPEQAPEVAGAKLSILDVKCRDQAGRLFVVEMQMLHMAGFLNRVVFNACKAYVGQLPRGGAYGELADVIVLSVCDFVLWPDEAQRAAGREPVPLVSRWSVRERVTGTEALQQVQYAFVELPKVPTDRVLTRPSEQWAWMFQVGEHEGSIPAQASEAQRQVLELCNEASFSDREREAYRKVHDEIWQARQLALDAEARGEARGKAEGEARGKAEGEAKGLRAAIAVLCEVLDIELSAARRARLTRLSAPELEALLEALRAQRRWPRSAR